MTTNVPRLQNAGRRSMHGYKPIDSICRRFVHQKLQQLKGSLLITDAWGETVTGDQTGRRYELRIKDPVFYRRLLISGSLGAAEGWMDDQWSTDDLTGLIQLFVRNIGLSDTLDQGLSSLGGFVSFLGHRNNANTHGGSRRNIKAHYDLGNDLFSLFLDRTMTYSSAIFETGEDALESASSNKLDRICRKLNLGKGDHLLEIGCGWGSLAIHAARHYGAQVTAVTISRSQLEFANSRAARLGLSKQIDFQLRDYRNIKGRYQKIASIEMIEAVGHQYLPTFFSQCGKLLSDDGCLVIQAITMPCQRYKQYLNHCDFIQKYIFPGSCVPSLSVVLSQVQQQSDMKLVHMEDIGAHYARTLRIWHERFSEAEREVRALGYPERFIRLWHYYLSYCEAGFSERYLSDLQLAFVNPGWRGSIKVDRVPELSGA